MAEATAAGIGTLKRESHVKKQILNFSLFHGHVRLPTSSLAYGASRAGADPQLQKDRSEATKEKRKERR